MKTPTSFWRVLVILGLLAMVIGAIDPLEGSLVILPGSAVLAVGAYLSHDSHRVFVLTSFLLMVVGVGALWGFSAIGGFGGNTGRSMWYALVLLPYPVGWVMGLVGAVRILRSGFGARPRQAS